jgi:DNA modification methylase
MVLNNKVFAAEYDREEHGWIRFPKDTQIRAELFPALDPTMHVAKANLWMVKSLIEYVSEPGESIFDPFAGTGTVLVGATMGRVIQMVELEPPYQQILKSNISMLKPTVADIEERTLLLEGDSMKLLPIPDFCDHMIYSPPYPQGLKKKGVMDKASVDLGYASATDYSADPNNFTNLNAFMYHQRIEIFYKKCLQTVKVGGTMTIIIKDNMEAGVRMKKADRTIADCVKMGWKLADRFKWLAMGGGYSATNRAHGLETVDDEDLIVFKREK